MILSEDEINSLADAIADRVAAISQSTLPAELIDALRPGYVVTLVPHGIERNPITNFRVTFIVEPDCLRMTFTIHGGQTVHEHRLYPSQSRRLEPLL